MSTLSVDYQTASGHAVVVGLGRSGVACATFLMNSGWDVEVGDVRSHPQLEDLFQAALPGIPIHSPLDTDIFLSTDLVALSGNSVHANSGISKIAKDCGAEVVNGLELFLQHRTRPIVAIAGSNGKSTVASLLATIIESHKAKVLSGGCRGFTFPELLNKQPPDVYVLELSALHLEQIQRIAADVSTVLNVSADDRSRYPNFNADALARTFSETQCQVVNRDDPGAAARAVTADTISFGLDEPLREQDFGIVVNRANRWIARGSKRLVNMSRCALKGRHNERNLLAACALAQAIGFPVDAVRNQVVKFEGLPHRCIDHGFADGLRWINDSRSTNTAAVSAAVETQSAPVVLICGGISQGADFSAVVDRVGEQIRGYVVYGRDAEQIASSLQGFSQVAQVEDLESAVSTAAALAEDGDSVVFSPGCASFDMFTDYEHRGDAFCELVTGSAA